MTVIDACAGAGGWEALSGVDALGIELDSSACAIREAAGLRALQADIAALNPLDFAPCEGWIGSPPCFPAETLITTMRGQIPISEVRVGDRTLTHRGRWRRVQRTGSQVAETVIARGQGADLEATHGHPIWARAVGKQWDNDARRYDRTWADPEWTQAADIAGRFWATPSHIEPIPVPQSGLEQNTAFWWMVGRWVGDGWVRQHNRRDPGVPRRPRQQYRPIGARCLECPKPAAAHAQNPALATAYCSKKCKARVGRRHVRTTGDQVFICCAHGEASELHEHLRATGLNWSPSPQRTSMRFIVSCNRLVDWLAAEFGKGAANKQIPSWTMAMPTEDRAALLEGYLSADGYDTKHGRQATTVSKRLAVSVRLLAETLGYTTRLGHYERPAQCVIEGRVVNQRSTWVVGMIAGATKHVRRDDRHTWGLVRKVLPGRTVRVFNLQVAGDASYVADGIVVHNCPTFSSAGRGSGRDLESIIRAAIKDLADGHDTRAERRREAYELLEPETARFDTLARPRKARKREQHAVSPANRQRIAKREAKRATARQEATTSLLVVEPLRWALALSPRWIALEQVPPVLPLWEAMADVLRERGYSVWCGILSAERYGCPQTRQRAILIASLDRVVSMPPPTHQRYIAPRKRAAEATADALFAVPEPERIVAPEDRHLLPWLSMAEALDWHGGAYRLARGAGMCERHGERPDTPMSEPAPVISTKVRTASWVLRNNSRENATTRAADEPAPTITAGHDHQERRWVVDDPPFVVGSPEDCAVCGRITRPDAQCPCAEPTCPYTRRGAGWVLRAGTNENDCSRPVDSPAPTIRYGPRLNDVSWVLRSGQSVAGEGRAERSTEDPSPTQQAEALAKGRDVWVRTNNSTKGGTREGLARPADEPSRTVDGQASQWTVERPSTTVHCDPRIAEPGRHEPGENGSQYGPETVRVSIAEAAALQSFPADWPWHAAGTKTAAFRAVGNAIPPLLALHVLLAVVGPELAASLQERLAALTNRKDARQ